MSPDPARGLLSRGGSQSAVRPASRCTGTQVGCAVGSIAQRAGCGWLCLQNSKGQAMSWVPGATGGISKLDFFSRISPHVWSLLRSRCWCLETGLSDRAFPTVCYCTEVQCVPRSMGTGSGARPRGSDRGASWSCDLFLLPGLTCKVGSSQVCCKDQVSRSSSPGGGPHHSCLVLVAVYLPTCLEWLLVARPSRLELCPHSAPSLMLTAARQTGTHTAWKPLLLPKSAWDPLRQRH